MAQITIEERIALQDFMTDYCYAVDNLTDLDALVNLFTEDAVLDFSDIGLPLMSGRADVESFFRNVFADMTHHQHYIGNFRVEAFSGDSAAMVAYVQGLGRAKDGNKVHVHVRYHMDCVKRDAGWKCRRFQITGAMPMPDSLEEIHGEH